MFGTPELSASKGTLDKTTAAPNEVITIDDIYEYSLTLSNKIDSVSLFLKHFKVYYYHTDSGTLVSGQTATCTADGYKDAYYCAGCKKYFTDEACTDVIGDETAYKTWKTGDGKIAAAHGNYTYVLEDSKIVEKCGICGNATGKITFTVFENAVYNGEIYPLSSLTNDNTQIKDKDITIAYEKYDGTNWETIDCVPTNAGTYRASITAGGVTSQAKEFTIAKAKVTIPTAITGLVYNEDYQIGVNYDDTGIYTMSGTTKMDFAGDYIAFARLNDTNNYEWEDGTTENKTIEWSIAKAEYNITSGANGKLTKGSINDYSITANGPYNEFQGLKIDAEFIVNNSDYTAKSGSTIITLSKAYLETLSLGTHNVEMIWNNGSATTTLTIAEKAPVSPYKSPNTGVE